MREENLTIIRALNKYGRVPETWELLQEIEKYESVLDKIKEMTKDLFETEYEGIYKEVGNSCCERFYLLNELNKLLEEIK